MFAKVLLGLPVEGPFDYSVAAALQDKIAVGARVEVSFGPRRIAGYVIGLAKKTRIKNIKPVLSVLDDHPALDGNMLLLTKEVSEYYCCSWGQVIETSLPAALRKRTVFLKLDGGPPQASLPEQPAPRSLTDYVTLIHDLDGKARWENYAREIKKTITEKKSVILLLPDVDSVIAAKATVASGFDCPVSLVYRKQPKELDNWLQIKRAAYGVVIGTRSAVFAPVKELGLIIVDEEQEEAYKQDQVPHYHAREAAFMRARIENATLLLGSGAPSLETFLPAKEGRIKYLCLGRKKPYPEIKIIEELPPAYDKKKRGDILSKYFQDAVAAALHAKSRILFFLNRSGFATAALCRRCGTEFKCPRCNTNLVYHFKEDTLDCHYCSFKMKPPEICPNCNSDYIRYVGAGTEKMESELSRLFPQAKIGLMEKKSALVQGDADIFVSSRAILKKGGFTFDLIGVLSIDNALNRPDLRSSEKTFSLLAALSKFTESRMVIQSRFTAHHCFKALAAGDHGLFYGVELAQRKQLGFPPYAHLCLLKLRGKRELKVKDQAFGLFEKLKSFKGSRGIKVLSVNACEPPKLRGNFYWQILLSSRRPQSICAFLKKNLKDFKHSGIIVTADMDPL